jgi:hypothetical protein
MHIERADILPLLVTVALGVSMALAFTRTL